jgi:hypothetical protein
LHPELAKMSKSMPKSLSQLGNMVFYGPSGSGKYTQFLRCIEPYSENRLKMEKMTAQTEKQTYEYRISDVHYEIDLALLGCESKKLWNESFFQIVDAISAKMSKTGIILCKNFHAIHSELLDVFYSYMQHCRALSVHIAFVLLTEHVSFIPNRVLQCCKIVAVKRPEAKMYTGLNKYNSAFSTDFERKTHKEFSKNIGLVPASQSFITKPYQIEPESIVNLKETRILSRNAGEGLPKDVFNIICDNIIQEMIRHKNIRLLELRDHLYDILLYGLDITECLWYILRYFVESGELTELTEILTRIDAFLKYYNNNYRPIYHLESIFIYLITEIYQYPPLEHEP